MFVALLALLPFVGCSGEKTSSDMEEQDNLNDSIEEVIETDDDVDAEEEEEETEESGRDIVMGDLGDWTRVKTFEDEYPAYVKDVVVKNGAHGPEVDATIFYDLSQDDHYDRSHFMDADAQRRHLKTELGLRAVPYFIVQERTHQGSWTHYINKSMKYYSEDGDLIHELEGGVVDVDNAYEEAVRDVIKRLAGD